ncbi:MAG: hypothetical protein E7651_03160 [Ruminococcaceae bacterium]|nr:hypothetical protein [Oscillospiraceae bacterium]
MKRVLPLILTVCTLLSLLPFAVYGEGAEELTKHTLNGIDTDCRTGQMVVYTGGGTATGTDEKCTEALVGADGRVISVGGHNNTVPEGGFVLAGSSSKAKYVEALEAGDGVFYSADTLTVTIVPKGYDPFYETSVQVDGVNTTRKQDTIILFDGKDGKTATGTNAWGFEVTVDKDGCVIAVGGNDSPIPEGGYVLSGHGTGKTALEEAAKGGMKVTLSSDRKTATFAFDKDSAYQEYVLEADAVTEAYDTAKAEDRLIDLAAADKAVAALRETLDELKSALDGGDHVGYLRCASQLEALGVQAKRAITEDISAEARGVWLRPALVTDRDKIFDTVNSILEAGYNQVYLEVQFDNTMIIPLPEGNLYAQNPALAGSDILKTYIEACHYFGIEIHAWMSVFRAGYKGSSNTDLGVAMQKPEWRQVSKNGVDFVANAYGDAFFLNPALPEVQAFLLETYRYILENYDIDGFQLDYIRYPNKADGEEFGYDEYTLKLYKDEFGKDPKTFANGSEDYTHWVQFRGDFVTDFVKKVKELIGEIRPDVYLGAAVAPNYANSLNSMCQDSVTWMKEGLIDIVFPMAYGTTDGVIRYLEETVAAAGDKVLVIPGVSDQGAEVLEEQILASREGGADGVAFFSWNVYDQRYDAIGEWVFAKQAVSTSYSGKDAMVALLKQLSARGERSGSLLNEALTAKLKEAAQALEKGTLSACEKTVREALDAVKAQAEGAEYGKAYLEDLTTAYRILNTQRDDAKEAYRKEHPLPEPWMPGEEEESREESTESDTENSGTEESKEEIILTPVENFFRIFSMVILFGGLALFPVYYVLNMRRRKIIRSFSEPKEEDEEEPLPPSEE